MNTKNYNSLQEVMDLLENAKEIIEQVKGEEQEEFNNLSEELQQNENSWSVVESFSKLNEIILSLDNIIMKIELIL